MRLTGSRTYYRPSPPKMPPGLVELMEGLTKEVLKQNPSDIYEFCAKHVQQLLEKRDGPSNKKSLSLEEKIARAQQKVRQRAEIRKREYDINVFLQEHSNTQINNNTATNDEINISSTSSVSRSIIDSSNMVNFVSNNDTLDLYSQEQTAKSSHKAPLHHEHALEKSSEIEVCQTGSEFFTQEHDVDTTLSKINGLNVESTVSIPESKKEFELTDNLHVGHLKNMELADNEDAVFIPVEIKTGTVSDNLVSKEVYVTDQNESISTTQTQKSDHDSGKDNDEVVVPATVNVAEDGVILIEETSKSHVTDRTKINLNLESSNSHIRNTIKIEQKEKSKDSADIQHETSDNNIENIAGSNQQTDQNVSKEEIDYNTTTVTLEDNNVPPGFEKIGQASVVLESHEEEDNAGVHKVVDELFASKNNQSYQGNVLAEEDYSNEKAVAKDLETELFNPSNNLPVVIAASAVKEPDSNLEKAVKDVHLYLDLAEPYSVIKINTPDNEFDQKAIIAASDMLTPKSSMDHHMDDSTSSIQINESMSATSPTNDDKDGLEQTDDNLNMSLVELSSGRDLNVDALDRHQKFENSSTDLLSNSSSVPIHISEVVNCNNSEIISSLPIDNNSERDNHHSPSMDLETAAITIQKVFRSFLFKSRGSTLEDTVNDETMFLDEDINKEECDFAIESISPKNSDRRAHGITRMDTILQTVNEEKSLSLSTDDSSTLSSAATTIQAHVRGFLVRNKLNSNKTNSSLGASNSNELTTTPVDAGNDQQIKTVLNIHIVPENGDDLSRDESFITSMDLSLDSPSSTNLHPSNDDKNERRRRLKREDAIQSVSPPSNNSGKLSDDIDSVKETVADDFVHDSNAIKIDIGNTEHSMNVSKEECSLQTTEINKNNIEDSIDSIGGELKLNQKRKSLTKLNSDERDVVTPFTSNDDSGLLHSGEFHDAVVPTKVSRSDTSVVSGE